MQYVIMGKPIPLKRPRMAQKHVWNSQKELQVITGIELKRQHNDKPLYAKPIKVYCTFYFEIPSSKSKKLKPLTPYAYRPDIDNLEKYILDAFKDIIITDDAIVAEIHSKKLYDKKPRTEIIIIEL